MAENVMDEIMSADGPVTQDQIRELRVSGIELLQKARAMEKLALAQLDMARKLCQHPNKKFYVCPDCGLDTSPDGY